ncbi:quinone-dependent dihydroorotate dehydrogenase [Lutibaculum baratangense]|uniref:quinone-dependent dihydroorotate dehydrogenase n=1 Tax=Lutibaculum baratangense TaxID=1358440 RepID=UPI00058E35FA|nr:quinone-dependent dihydroorotate dehydrogenase [Lutibaculum baratangense]
MSGLYGLARPLLFRLDPEQAHGLAIRALRSGAVRTHPEPADPRLRVTLWDLDFPNPIGMAAGFDKNAEVPGAVLDLGFGFVEVGTLTPRPQAGNPRPRMFRLVEDGAVINRLGFNNEGHEAALRRLETRQRKGIVGVNIGANKDTADKAADYAAGIAVFAPVASYLTINISSPNTPGLRDLQHEAALDDLLGRCVAARDQAREVVERRVPLLLKIAPDLDQAACDGIAEVVSRHAIDGLIVSNTTLERQNLASAHAAEAGGLSGRPLFRLSTEVLARMHRRLPDLPLIGVGGVDSGAAAYEKIRAGASLVQLYTGLVYEGYDLPRRICRDLVRCLRRDGFSSVAAAVGTAA